MCSSELETALWDIKGKALGVPVYELLGGAFRDDVEVYANGWWADSATTDDLARAAERTVADGYRALKFYPLARVRAAAERNAIAGAVMAADKEIVAVLVITATEHPTFPCGMCRQVLAEFNPAMLVISTTTEGKRAEQSLTALLPSNFSQHDLEAANALKR